MQDAPEQHAGDVDVVPSAGMMQRRVASCIDSVQVELRMTLEQFLQLLPLAHSCISEQCMLGGSA